MKNLTSRILGGTALFATAVSLTAGVQAQETILLEEIVVTAQRREERLQVVPVSVTALTREALESRGITDMTRLDVVTPGFTFARSGTDARPAMRGVRTENVGINGDTTIGFFVDGIYQSRAQQAMAGFIDVERVEVLRGPQGTLFGRNTFGGSIAVTTQKPGEDLSYGGSVDFSRFNTMRAEVFANVPMSEQFQARIAGYRGSSDGYVRNDNIGKRGNLFDDDTWYVRPSVRFAPNDDLEVLVNASYTEQGGAGGSAFGYKQLGTYFDPASGLQLFNGRVVVLNVRAGNRDGINDFTNAAGVSSDIGIPLYKAGDGYHFDANYPTFLDLESKSVTGQVSYNLGEVMLRSITGYVDFDANRSADTDFSASTIGIDYQDTAAKTFSQEVQALSRGDGPLQYTVGAYFFHDKTRGVFINQQLPRIVRSPLIAAPLNLAQNGNGFYDETYLTTKSWAAYGQASYALTDQLKATAGVRYTEDKKSFRGANGNSLGIPLANINLTSGLAPAIAFGQPGVVTCTGGAFAGVAGAYCPLATPAVNWGFTYRPRTFDKATWRAGLDYQATPDNLLYASASTGFRSGGFNSGQAIEAARTFLPEKVTAYEVGSKNEFMNNTLRLNAAAFFNKYGNLQEQRQVPIGGTTVSIIFNAARAEAYGAEFEAEWLATDKLHIGATLSLLHAEYTRFDNVALPFGTSILVVDASVRAPVVQNGFTISPAGQRRVFAPGYSCGPVAGSNVAAPAFGCDLSGNKIPHAPSLSGSFYLAYDISMGTGTLTPSAIVSFASKYFGQPTNSILERQGGYGKLDLRLTYEAEQNWVAAAYVNNVTDKAVINRFVYGGGGALQASFAPPRVFGARVSVRY